jgi:hypothetical protein
MIIASFPAYSMNRLLRRGNESIIMPGVFELSDSQYRRRPYWRGAIWQSLITLAFNGMGVLEAVSNINDRIAPALSGILVENQALIGYKLKGKGGRV